MPATERRQPSEDSHVHLVRDSTRLRVERPLCRLQLRLRFRVERTSL